MADSKVIAVFGATGNQGGSIADTFLKDGWRVRAITRNASNSKAQDLAARGAEIAQADLDSSSSLRTAFEGAHVVFAVSDFWALYRDPSNANKPKQGQSLNAWAGGHETEQLKNVIDAVAGIPSVERFILSSLSGVNEEVVEREVHPRVSFRFEGTCRGLWAGEISGSLEENEYLPGRIVRTQLFHRPCLQAPEGKSALEWFPGVRLLLMKPGCERRFTRRRRCTCRCQTTVLCGRGRFWTISEGIIARWTGKKSDSPPRMDDHARICADIHELHES